MKIHIDRFECNNPELSFEDVITGIEAGIADSGIIHVRLQTRDKYVMMRSNGSVYCPEYKGQTITIHPFLYDNNNDLYETNYDAYRQHPDWYRISLVVETDLSCPTSVSTALKHEYWINYIPNELAFDYTVIKPVELIEWVD